MKTRANSFLKLLFLATLISTLITGCGKTNRSGGNSNSPVTTDPWVGGNVNGFNNMGLPSDWLQRLYNEYPCTNFYGNGTNQRITMPVTAHGPIQVNSGNLHIGVTLEGDILVISNSGNQTRAEVHACERPHLQNMAEFIQMPVLNVSDTCAMAQITAADVLLNSNYGVYQLAFFPAGLSSQTTLCQ